MPEIYTIGYEQTALADFLGTLQAAGVTMLIDIRELPLSRRAGFSKRQLAAEVEAVGIGYRHFQSLGTPKQGRVAHRMGDRDKFWRIVDGQLDRPEADLALEEVAALAQAQPSCLVCYEGDWRACHRARIVDKLAARHGFTAHHLRAEPALL